MRAPTPVGQTIGEALVRSKTGYTVVSVERDGTLITDVFPITSDPSVTIISLFVSGPAWLTGQNGLIQTGLQLPAAFVLMGWVWFRRGHLGISLTIRSKLE